MDFKLKRVKKILVRGFQVKESEKEEFLDLPPLPKKIKKSYELTRKFQMDWSIEEPWSEIILSFDGFLHVVKCCI